MAITTVSGLYLSGIGLGDACCSVQCQSAEIPLAAEDQVSEQERKSIRDTSTQRKSGLNGVEPVHGGRGVCRDLT